MQQSGFFSSLLLSVRILRLGQRFSVSRQTDIEEHHERDEEGKLA